MWRRIPFVMQPSTFNQAFLLHLNIFLSNEDDLKTVTLLYWPTRAPYNNTTLVKPFSFDEELPLKTPVFVLIKCWFKRLPYDEINQAYVFILDSLKQSCCSLCQSRTHLSILTTHNKAPGGILCSSHITSLVPP